MANFKQPIFNPYTVASAEDLNFMADSIEMLAEGLFGAIDNDARPIFRVRRTADLAITNNADPTTNGGFGGMDIRVPWQAIDEDSDTMASTATAGNRNRYLEIHTPGLWLFVCQQRYGPAAGGSRACKMMRNGPNPINDSFSSAKLPSQNDGEGTTLQMFSFIECALNDKIFINTWSTAATTLLAGGLGGTWFAGVWLGPVN